MNENENLKKKKKNESLLTMFLIATVSYGLLLVIPFMYNFIVNSYTDITKLYYFSSMFFVFLIALVAICIKKEEKEESQTENL
jgi:cytochrome bd-type quinol oxidase subunit 2